MSGQRFNRFLVEHPSHIRMLSHRGPKFDCPRQCLSVFVIKRGVKLRWGCKFLIAILDWLSPLSCDSDSWEKCQYGKYYFVDKGNCVLCCFVDLMYVDGSQRPARPESLLHSLKYVIASYILKICLNETRCVQRKVITTSPLVRTATGHIARYSRTPHMRTLVIRIAIHPNRLGRSCKHFLTLIVLHHFGA